MLRRWRWEARLDSASSPKQFTIKNVCVNIKPNFQNNQTSDEISSTMRWWHPWPECCPDLENQSKIFRKNKRLATLGPFQILNHIAHWDLGLAKKVPQNHALAKPSPLGCSPDRTNPRILRSQIFAWFSSEKRVDDGPPSAMKSCFTLVT